MPIDVYRFTLTSRLPPCNMTINRTTKCTRKLVASIPSTSLPPGREGSVAATGYVRPECLNKNPHAVDGNDDTHQRAPL